MLHLGVRWPLGLVEPHQRNESLSQVWLTDLSVDDKLDVVDAFVGAIEDLALVQPVADAFDFGRSVWRVSPAGRGLERRVSESLTALTDRVARASGGSAGNHLRGAWQAAWGLHPDPSKALGEAIKAVECAAIPVVLPRDPGATLGKVIGELRSTSARWVMPMESTKRDPIQSLVGMLELLWHGQSDRHGGVDLTVAVTQEQAEAALPVAVALVDLFQSRAVRRR
jgi:hypothetical protein